MMRLSFRLLGILLLVSSQAYAEWNYTTIEGAGDVPLNMVTAGDPANPAILLIHGIGQSHYSFVHQLNSDLTDDFYLVSFDMRGHGASGKPWNAEAYTDYRQWAGDIDAVLNASGARQPVAVGWSYGSIVLMDYLREFGTERLAAINLTGALGGITPFRMPSADDPRSANFAEIRKLQMSNDFAERQQAAERMVDLLTSSPIPAPYRDVFMSVGFMMPMYVRTAMLGRRIDNQDLLDEMEKVPVLLSIGSEDSPFSNEDGEMLARRYANYTFSQYADTGHSVFFEQPDRYNAELRAFALRSQKAEPAAVSRINRSEN